MGNSYSKITWCDTLEGKRVEISDVLQLAARNYMIDGLIRRISVSDLISRPEEKE